MSQYRHTYLDRTDKPGNRLEQGDGKAAYVLVPFGVKLLNINSLTDEQI
jgi:hypothetical protein